jgi:hypothetical protein
MPEDIAVGIPPFSDIDAECIKATFQHFSDGSARPASEI